jgi:uncharacterized protein involved in outer membrane biogenesis
MQRLRKAAAVLALLAAALAGALLLLDSGAVRERIERQIAARASGQLRYESLAVRLLPWPRVELRGVTLAMPGAVEGTIAAAEIRPALLPLLAGRFRPSDLRVDRPVLQVSIAPDAAGDPLSIYRRVAGPAVSALVREADGMRISVREGRIEFLSAGTRILSLSALEGWAKVQANGIDADLSGAADLWQRAQARARIEAGSLAGSASLQLTGLRLGEWMEVSVGGAALRVQPAPVDAKLDIETDGASAIRLRSALATAQLVIRRGARSHDLGAVRAAWDIVRDARTLTLTLKELQLGALARGAAGEIRIPLDRAVPVFEFRLAQLDLARLHAAAAALAGSGTAAPAPFSFVPAGILRDLALSGAWSEGRAGLDIGALRADARIESATVAVPAAGILVRNGSGRFRLADGVLQGSELAGEIGNSSFSAGSLALDRPEGIRLRSLGAALRTDLADVLAIARRLSERQPHPAIAAIEALEGRATGAIDFDFSRSESRLKLQLANLDAKMRIRDVPFAVAAKRGELQGSAGVLRARGLAGTIGRSQVRDANFELALGGEAAIRSASGEAVLALGELFSWLRRREALPPALAGLESMTGDARVRLARLSGPVAKPAALEFDASVEPSKVELHSPSLHAPWVLASGKAEISARRLELKQLAVAAGDTRATLSGTIDDYAGTDRRADLHFSQAALGPQGLAWLRARWALPDWAVPRTPLEIADARLRWPGALAEPVVVQGRLRFADGLDADVDVAWRADELEVKRLKLKDADTDASATLHWRKAAAVEWSFDGKFDHRSFARLLAHPLSERAAASGSFRASLDLRAPVRSSAAGALQVTGGGIGIAGQRVDVNGRLEGRQDGLRVDGELRARTLDAEKLIGELADLRESAGAGRQPLWDLPISGRLEVAADTIIYGRRKADQVAGSIDIAQKRVSIDIAKGKFCGVDAQIAANVTPAGVDAKARLQARGLAVGDSLPCLAGEELVATGTFDLDADLAARGAAGDLLRAASGKYRFVARDGLIRKEKVIDSVLSEKEVAARLNAGTRKLAAEGFPYREISVAGTIDAGKANLDPGIIDSPDIGMTLRGTVGLADGSLDLEGLVAPFDEGRRRGQGGALGGPLVVVPVAVRGSLRDPKVSVNTAAAVGTALVRLMSARFLLPLQLINISGADSPRD